VICNDDPTTTIPNPNLSFYDPAYVSVYFYRKFPSVFSVLDKQRSSTSSVPQYADNNLECFSLRLKNLMLKQRKCARFELTCFMLRLVLADIALFSGKTYKVGMYPF
jgi:hypothetical protein